MSVLTVCQNAARLIGIGVPTQVVNSTNVNALKLLEAFVKSGKERRRKIEWPTLIKTQTITLQSGIDTYTLNEDFWGFVSNTVYDITNSMPMMGALPAWKWAHLKYGIGDASPYIKFRVAGRTNKRFQIHPVPSASGAQITFSYISKSWILPQEWVTARTYTEGTYVSNLNGDIYTAVSTGTSGATEPTHTSGDASDGGVSWRYYSGAFDRPMSDNDESVLEEELLELDVIWQYRKHNGLDYQVFQAEADQAWETYYGSIAGNSTIRFDCEDEDAALIGIGNLPYTGYAL